MNEKVALNVLGITYNRTHPETLYFDNDRGGRCTAAAYCH